MQTKCDCSTGSFRSFASANLVLFYFDTKKEIHTHHMTSPLTMVNLHLQRVSTYFTFKSSSVDTDDATEIFAAVSFPVSVHVHTTSLLSPNFAPPMPTTLASFRNVNPPPNFPFS